MARTDVQENLKAQEYQYTMNWIFILEFVFSSSHFVLLGAQVLLGFPNRPQITELEQSYCVNLLAARDHRSPACTALFLSFTLVSHSPFTLPPNALKAEPLVFHVHYFEYHFLVKKMGFHAYQRWTAPRSFPNMVALCYLNLFPFGCSNFSRGISFLSKLSLPFCLTEKGKLSTGEAPRFSAWRFFCVSWLSPSRLASSWIPLWLLQSSCLIQFIWYKRVYVPPGRHQNGAEKWIWLSIFKPLP